MSGARAVFRNVWPPLVFGIGFLVLWEAMVQIFDLKPYFLPTPSSIWTAFHENAGLIWDATKVSGMNALVGLLVGTVLGVAISFLLMPWTTPVPGRTHRWCRGGGGRSRG